MLIVKNYDDDLFLIQALMINVNLFVEICLH